MGGVVVVGVCSHTQTKLHECAAVDVSRDSSSRAQQRTADRSTSTATSTPGPLRRFRKFLSSRLVVRVWFAWRLRFLFAALHGVLIKRTLLSCQPGSLLRARLAHQPRLRGLRLGTARSPLVSLLFRYDASCSRGLCSCETWWYRMCSRTWPHVCVACVFLACVCGVLWPADHTCDASCVSECATTSSAFIRAVRLSPCWMRSCEAPGGAV